jgi:23S rRNA pseudouridine1911/1915/1917 synthase
VWVVQRLDTATSGVLVIAKTPAANRALSQQLQCRSVDRAYAAIVRGRVPWDQTTIDRPVRGKRAVTHAVVIERFGDLATRVRCKLDTGRTHQIRIHCARAGHAVCGDPRHGQRSWWDPPRTALHASELGFDHPRTGERLSFECPMPAELSVWLERLAALECAGSPPARLVAGE